MANESQRYHAVERLLRRGVGAPGVPAAADACVHGETLAAWSSGALAPAAAARVETHLADCDRCQSMLAAFARTEPVIAARAPFWQRAQVRWLVPLATAATVAAIWVATPQRDEPSPSVAQLREPAALPSSGHPRRERDPSTRGFTRLHT